MKVWKVCALTIHQLRPQGYETKIEKQQKQAVIFLLTAESPWIHFDLTI